MPGSFRDSPAPRSAAVGLRSQQVATLPCGLTEVLALAVGNGHAGRVTLPGFGPVAGTRCRFSPRYRVTKSRTRRCQRTSCSPVFRNATDYIPSPVRKQAENQILRNRENIGGAILNHSNIGIRVRPVFQCLCGHGSCNFIRTVILFKQLHSFWHTRLEPTNVPSHATPRWRRSQSEAAVHAVTTSCAA